MVQLNLYTSDASVSQIAAIEVKNVYKSYKIGRVKNEILKHVNLNVGIGVIYGLLGPSGCGKSTLLKCVVGSLKADSGEISVFGKKLGSPESNVPGSCIGYMPQELALYNQLTISEALKYYGKLHYMTSNHIFQRMVFLLKLLKLPDERLLIENLSDGQKRRMSFAIALFQEPPLLVLDEPTVGVDPILRQNVWDYLMELSSSGRTTTVITTHYVEEVKQANQVGFMRNGRILVEDKPENLMVGQQSLEDVFLKLCYQDSSMSYQDEPNLLAKEETKDKGNIVQDVFTKKKRNQIAWNFLPSWTHISAVVWKNIAGMRKSLGRLLFQFIIPAMQIFIFCIAIGRLPYNLSVAVVNSDKLNGAKYLQFIDNKTISLVMVDNVSAAVDMVLDRRSTGVIEIDEHFTDGTFQRFFSPKTIAEEMLNSSLIHVHLDMTSYEIALTLQRTLLMAYEKFAKANMVTFGIKDQLASSPVVIEEPIYGKMEPEFIEYTGPALMCGITYFMALGLTTLCLIVERKEGVQERNYVAGVSAIEMMCSDIITQFGISIIQVIFSLVATYIALNMQVRPNIFYIALLLFLQALAGISNGYTISTIFYEEQSAISVAIGWFYLNVLLSGVVWPLEGIVPVLRTIAKLLPMTLATESLRSMMSRELTITDSTVLIGFLSTFIWIVIWTIMSILSTRTKR